MMRVIGGRLLRERKLNGRQTLPHTPSGVLFRQNASGTRFLGEKSLLDGAANLGKDVVGIGSDEPDRAHDNHKNNRQHHGIFRDILAMLIVPELT